MAEKSEFQATESSAPNLLEVDTSQLPSVTLARLIEEVRNEEPSAMHPYDRVHNRHNRGH